MSWYTSVESTDTHILWSKVRYLRALASLPFDRAMIVEGSPTHHAYGKIDAKLEKVMADNGFHKEAIPAGFCAEVCALAEKQFISFDFATAGEWRAAYFNEPCSLSISTGGESYFSIQALTGGGTLSEAHKIASEAEELLDGNFEFAYSDKLGYLSRDISKCGAGVELSCALFLPTLRHGTRLQEVKERAEAFGAVLSPLLSKYDNAGDIYLIKYRPVFRSDEDTAVSLFSELAGTIIADEKRNERMIFSNKSTLIIDRAYRALGILAYVKMLDEEEMLSLLSRIRLSLALDECRNDAPPVSTSFINSLLAEGLNNTVITSSDLACENLDDVKAARAKIINRRVLESGKTS